MVIFKNIGELLTFSGAAKKQGRQVKESDLGIISNAAMACESGKIVWIGPSHQIPQKILRKQKKIVNLNGKTVIPGLVECHTHSLFGGSRANEFELRNQGLSYQELAARGGGIQSTVKDTRETSDHELLKRLKENIYDFVAQGVTTIEVKSGYGLSHASEIRLLQLIRKIKNINCVPTYLGPHAKSPDFLDFDSYLQEIVTKTLPVIKKLKLANRADIFVEKGYFSLDQAQLYWQTAKSLGMQILGHLEQLSTSRASLVAVKMGAISIDHLVYLKREDISEVAKSNTVCVLLPTADFYLKMSYPPARQLIDEGAIVALATDYNPGSSPSSDISLVGVLARTQMGMSLPEVLSAYTVGAALALGMLDNVGSLEVGKSADFVVLDGSWQELFYQVGKMPVESTWSKNKKIFQKKIAF